MRHLYLIISIDNDGDDNFCNFTGNSKKEAAVMFLKKYSDNVIKEIKELY